MDAPRRNAIIAFGSNLGDREATIKQAANEVADVGGTVLLKLSPLYESAAVKPEGVDLDAPEYLNAVALISTDLPPEALLSELAGIEQDHGRERHERWGDRTLDLDIIWMDGVLMETENLTIPHPRAFERSFVVVPWNDVQPGVVVEPHGPIAALADKLTHELRRYEVTV
jgi:2-amino-4-hydroxy-6-hydroxymethyldihydropteridine diphosphokinase